MNIFQLSKTSAPTTGPDHIHNSLGCGCSYFDIKINKIITAAPTRDQNQKYI